MIKFHIFHTNDLHSSFEQWPKIVTLLNDKKTFYANKNEEVLLFDIGDNIDRFHPLTEATFGKVNVQLMNKVGYDCVTIGNNEGITLSKEKLTELYENSTFPIVIANLFETNSQRPKWLKPFEIIHLKSGITIGVVGLTIPFQSFYEALGWRIEDPFDILPPIIEEIREKVDLVILLSHLGLNFDEQIAEKINGIDIILGGHTHHVLEKGLFINRTMVNQAGKFGQYVGHLEITYDLQTTKTTNYNASCLVVNDYLPCEKTEEHLNELTDKQLIVLNEKVCFLSERLSISWEKPSSFAELLASAVKEWCEADIGMINSGLLLDHLKQGVVTKADLHRVCPHPINPCKVPLLGMILKEVIHHSLSEEMMFKKIRGFGFRGKVMGIMVFDGITYEEKRLADGLKHIFNIKINGKKIENKQVYHVATIDMFTFGHLYPSIAAAKEKKYYMPELLRDVLAWKLNEYR